MLECREIPTNPNISDQKNCLSMRYMDLEDLSMVLDWCKEEGWNVGQYDASVYYRFDRKAHMLFLLDENPVGAISIVKYNEKFFSLGPFIVKKEYRRKGYGAQIWQKALELIEKSATIALFSVHAQINRYHESGFESKYQLRRWELADCSGMKNLSKSSCQIIKKEHIPDISIYDQTIFGASRQRLLKKLIKMPLTTGCFLKNGDKICGFGMIRPCSLKGYRVGPLFADTIENAKEIFVQLINVIDKNDILLDIPASNKYAVTFAEYFNLSPISQNDTEAMFRGEPPFDLINNADKTYGIFSLEIG